MPNRTLLIAFLAIIALSAVVGLAAMLLAPAPGVTAADDEFVTWVRTPEQDGIETPPEFILPELESFVFPEGENLAKGKNVKFSDFTDVYPGKQAVDGRDRTYWEGASFPSWLTVDLEESHIIGRVVVQVPPIRVWSKRTQTVEISVSEDGEGFTVVVPGAERVFDPMKGNAVLLEFEQPISARYVKVSIASNTGANGGQLSEFYIYE
jgi:hypothetical protein